MHCIAERFGREARHTISHMTKTDTRTVLLQISLRGVYLKPGYRGTERKGLSRRVIKMIDISREKSYKFFDKPNVMNYASKSENVETCAGIAIRMSGNTLKTLATNMLKIYIKAS